MKDVRESHLGWFFPPAYMLFQLPALALAGGVTLIYLFIVRTDAAIQAKKRAQAKAK